MNTITAPMLQQALLLVCDRIIDAEPMLTELDTIIGDGDHGIGMSKGFTALSALLRRENFSDPALLLRETGMTLLKVMGGTSGVIFGTMFVGGIHAVTGKDTLSVRDLAMYFHLGTAAIAKRGKVARGDKTMYDALIEASETLDRAAEETDDIAYAFSLAADAAEAGAEKTKEMLSRKGRSKNFRDRTLGHPDSGAVSTSIIFRALADAFAE